MGALGVENGVYDIKLSSVVPATITGDNVVHELTTMDLVMKLHYLRGVYYFEKEAVEGLTVYDFKFPMFEWLDLYYPAAGRIRISESGQPFIKCNDGGVRVVEAQCSMTLEECLDERNSCVRAKLYPGQVLGPDLSFTPLVSMQFTRFKCGGMSVGLSWAHVLGDAFTASNFINVWGRIMAGKSPTKPLSKAAKSESQPSAITELLSIKKIQANKDSWVASSNCRMETLSFQLSATQLKQLKSKTCKCNQRQTSNVPVFETLCAVIWHSLAKIRGDSQTRTVNICRTDLPKREDGVLGNNQNIGIVKAVFSVVEAEPFELAALLVKQLVDETCMIENVSAGDHGLSDFIVYGANLTFVNLENADLYGAQLKGHKPIFTSYTIDGVGEEGAILVLPGPDPDDDEGKEGGGRTLTLVLPESEAQELRNKLKEEWDIV